MVGLAKGLRAAPEEEIHKALLLTTEQKLASAKEAINWGPEIDTLPKMTTKQVQEKVKIGNNWIIIEDLVYDVGEFYSRHPGGESILKAYLGRDATSAFKGGLNHHTQSARTLARTMVVGRIVA